MESKPKNLKRATIQGTIWSYISMYSGKGLVFLSTIILARLLVQEDFGVAAYALIVISFLDVLSDLGIGAALIYHRREAKSTETAFFLNLGMGLALFGLTWLIAPLVGLFFNDPRAVPLVPILGLTFPLTALGNIHHTLLKKELEFQRKFIPDLVKAISKGVISITLAFLGFGAWSLVWGQVGGTAVGSIAYWLVVPWRPSLQFDKRVAQSFLSYGVNIVFIKAANVTLRNIDYLFVGRFLGAASLGVYTLAFRIPELLIRQFATVIAQVIFPAYVKLRDDPEALARGFLQTIRYGSLAIVPMAVGMALVAEPLVLTLFTEKWTEAAPVLSAISLYVLFRSLIFSVADVYKAQGQVGFWFMLSVIQVVIIVPALWWASTGPGTVTAVAWTQVGLALINGFIQLIAAQRILNVSISMILAALRPASIGGTILALAVWGTLHLSAIYPPPIQLVLCVSTGIFAYSATLWWLQREVVMQATHTLRIALIRR